jgi:hypothetical protein
VDFDLLAEGDAAVSRQVQRQWPGGRAGGRVLGDAVGGGEHARLPARAGPGDAADADVGQLAERGHVRLQRRNRLLAGEHEEDVPRPVAVGLDRKL